MLRLYTLPSPFRQGEANYLPDTLLETPLRTKEILKAILDSEEKGYIKSLYTKIYLELYAFKMLRLRYGRRNHRAEKAKNYDNNAVNTSSAASDSVILALDDIHQETELVYSITVNHHGKYVVRLRLKLDNVPKKGTSSSTSSDFFFTCPIYSFIS